MIQTESDPRVAERSGEAAPAAPAAVLLMAYGGPERLDQVEHRLWLVPVRTSLTTRHTISGEVPL